MDFRQWMDQISKGFEIVGVAILVVGFVWAAARAVVSFARTRDGRASYRVLRGHFGWSILLSLELLVAADLIRTVAVDPTLRNVAGLALIVLIRTFLSFSLEVEIEGRLPWRRAQESPLAAAPAAAVRQDRGGTSREP
jgi:uncharacterized membrane protein